jgi:phage terminase large subunit-like protein
MKVVKAANPFSGVTAKTLRRNFESPTMTLGHWRRFKCNLPTRSDDAAITELEWQNATSDVEIPAGEPVWCGLDVAWKWDTTAAVPLWVRDPEFRLFGPARVLTPPRNGVSLDPALVEATLLEIHDAHPIHTVVMDTTRAEQLADWIGRELGAAVVDRPQTSVLSGQDYERFMEALRNGWLFHSGDVALRRHALNAVARVLPGGQARFDRWDRNRAVGDAERKVIDALVAAAMVHAEAAGDIGAGFEPQVWVA